MRRIPKNHVTADFQSCQAGVTGFRSVVASSAFPCADHPWKHDPAVGFCDSGSGMAADYRPCGLLTLVRASAGYAEALAQIRLFRPPQHVQLIAAAKVRPIRWDLSDSDRPIYHCSPNCTMQ